MPHPYKHTQPHRQTNTYTDSFTLSLTLTLTLIHSLTHSLTLSLSLSLSLTQTGTRIQAWIRSTEEFLVLYGNVVAVVRNSLLRLFRHLVEVAGTPLFDESFCFKHMSLFCAPTGAFFRWYLPFPCYTKDFTCRSEVTLNPCISVTKQDFKNKKVFSV